MTDQTRTTELHEGIELLGPELLSEQAALVERFRRLGRRNRVAAGWHYWLDWVWLATRLGPCAGHRVLDAGAGIGAFQWYLAEQGADVVSVDRSDRTRLAWHFRSRYGAKGLTAEDLRSPWAVLASPRELVRSLLAFSAGGPAKPAAGRVSLHRSGLDRIAALPSASFDSVVSVSALEHNSFADLARIVEELKRVLRPGGTLLATLSAARDRDWYHDGSRGWCYSEASLRAAFRLSPEAASNWQQFDERLAALRSCEPLRRRLSWRYRLSGDNAMPWGRWDPQYVPVGVRATKS